jgi:hypothetical protein
MKKINSMTLLQTERKKVMQRQEFLEEKIRNNWNDLRVGMKPANIAKDAFNQVTSGRTRGIFSHRGVVKGLVSFGAALLVKRMMKKRADRLFKRR